MHGGKIPVVVAAAERRLAAQEAEGVIRDLWTQMDLATPVTDPVGAMQRLAGSLQELVDETGLRMDGAEGRALFVQSVAQLRPLLVDMQRLGLAEREVDLEQARAQRVTDALAAALDDLEPAARDTVLNRFLVGIGRAPLSNPAPVVRGEVE